MPKVSQETKKNSLEYIKELLEGLEKKQIYGTVTKVARSGMSRRIKFYIIKDNQPYQISRHVANVLEENLNDDGVLRKGCGMNMLFDAVYQVSRMIYSDGYAIDYRSIG